ncbi:HNH endonuclease [uncultured Selenomonas sp.]|uniref:HNH endonuclease n=1 Tax=uncultured Selenomonas sp. TaxID=159275 RepID=UPI0025D31B84|nr:HNH endonuclease [uncultured Selenomonas sp.]
MHAETSEPERVQALLSTIETLQRENRRLRKLLEDNGIVAPEDPADDVEELDQGSRILPYAIDKTKANQFFSRFWGRMDVYSQRIVSKSGTVGYYPQCRNFWKDGCFRKQRSGEKGKRRTCKECPLRSWRPEVFEDTRYTYRGRVKLAGPYETARQPDKDGHDRLVYRFPLRLIEENDALSEDAFQQFTQEEETRAKKLSKQALIARASKISEEHAKSSTASHRFVKTVQYERSATIAALTKERAHGICELCGNPAPFLTKDGTPYLECHHIEWLSHGGKDTIENTVALCPNCHRKMHALHLAEDIETLKRRKQTMDYGKKV